MFIKIVLVLLIIMVVVLIAGVSVLSYLFYRSIKRGREHELNYQDVLEKNRLINTNHQSAVQQFQKAMADKDAYITNVIQPMIFHRKTKFLELDGITYELFAMVEIITKYPSCINIIPVDMWNQIMEELVEHNVQSVVKELVNYKNSNPTKFTLQPFREVFWLAPIYNVPK